MDSSGEEEEEDYYDNNDEEEECYDDCAGQEEDNNYDNEQGHQQQQFVETSEQQQQQQEEDHHEEFVEVNDDEELVVPGGGEEGDDQFYHQKQQQGYFNQDYYQSGGCEEGSLLEDNSSDNMSSCYKGFFKQLKKEVTNEIGRQIDKAVNKGGRSSSGGGGNGEDQIQAVNMSAVEGILGLLGGGGGGSSTSGLNNLINTIQNLSGGQLPTNVGKLLPGILKVAEVIGHGMGDQGIRTEQNSDGSFIDGFVKTIVGGRKIHGGKGSRKAKAVNITPGNENSRMGLYGGTQDYAKIKDQCLSAGELFVDDEFPAEDASVYFSRGEIGGFQWMRPHEINSDPEFFVGGASRFDVKQGELGDCWLLAAVANLTLNEKLFHAVVPEDNSFSDGYCGAFHFRFWQYGTWVDVVIDDRLPTRRGKLVFMHSEDKNEFWSALLEKAYAKLHGSYEALKGGTTCEALEDFTGGITEMYEVKNGPDSLFQIMEKAFARSSFMGCSIEPDPYKTEAETAEGLIRGHAYSITSVKMVDIETPRVRGKIPLLRIRNPWGNEAEWKGPWSDGSKEWEYISDDVKEELGLTFDADGEFWMSYKDFRKYWDRLEICNLSAEGFGGDECDGDEDESSCRWATNNFEGAWIRGATAGGCRNYVETFACNPQYIINLESPDDENDKCTVLIALMQKNRRAQRKFGMECLTIGFAIYALGDPESQPKPLPMRFFKYNASVARSPTFINLREVCSRFSLSPGSYVIVPSTFEPNEEGEFILRVFTESRVEMVENDGDVGIGEVDDRVKSSDDEDDEQKRRVSEFYRTVAGEDGEIDWSELKEVLDLAMKKEFDFGGFSRDVCRSMVALMDVDMTGKLGLDEFIQLWKSVRTWKSVFKMYDHDSSGFLNAFELRQALSSAGYSVNNKILEALALRYGDANGQIYFDDFMMCAVKLKAMIEIFKERSSDGDKSATFSLEEWVQKTIYA